MEIPWALNSSRSYWDPGTILLAPVDFYVLLALFFFSPSSKPSFLLLYIFLITNKGISCILWASMGFLHGSVVKNMPTVQEMQETQIWFLNKEDPLEEGMTTHSNILAWRIPWTEESGGLQFMGSQRMGYDWARRHPKRSLGGRGWGAICMSGVGLLWFENPLWIC